VVEVLERHRHRSPVALAGSHDDASLFWTSMSLPAKPVEATSTTTQKASTTHLVTRPVSAPAI
jgi:hypothetical protein